METSQNISWQVSSEDLKNSPLGYEVKLIDSVQSAIPLVSHSTFDRTRDFFVDEEGTGDFEQFPSQGLFSASTSTVVKFVLNGESPYSTPIISDGTSLIKLSVDCRNTMLEKRVCGRGYSIDSVSCDANGMIWVKDTGGTITVMDAAFEATNVFRVEPDSIFSVVDPYRSVIWIVFKNRISMMRLKDLSISFSAWLPQPIDYVSDCSISAGSGTAFFIVSGEQPMAVAVTVTGIISTFSPGATGICQWGASGALACIPGSSRVDIFDGESASNHFGAYRFGMTSPTRITSIGSRAVFAVDDVGLVSKIDSNWNFQWSIQAPAGWTNVDIKAAPSSTDLGGVIYLSSATGVASYRDMLGEGWKYGECDVAADLGRYPSVFPVISVVPSLSNVRILAKTEAVTTPKGYTNSSWRESSSSSSVSSQSSDSSSSLSSISSSSSSPSNSVSSSSSPTGHFTYIPLGPFTVEITAYDPTGRPFMTIPDTIGSKNVATIGPQAFRNSTITGATMGSHVTSMLQRAFEGCINLTTVSISSGLTSISSMAFYGCTSLTSIYFQGNAPTVSSDSFTNVPSGCIVYYHPSATGFTNPWHGFTTATYP